MSRERELRARVEKLDARERELVEDLADVVARRRRATAALNRSLSAQARGARPPSPREREDRAQDEGEKRARRAARRRT